MNMIRHDDGIKNRFYGLGHQRLKGVRLQGQPEPSHLRQYARISSHHTSYPVRMEIAVALSSDTFDRSFFNNHIDDFGLLKQVDTQSVCGSCIAPRNCIMTGNPRPRLP